MTFHKTILVPVLLAGALTLAGCGGGGGNGDNNDPPPPPSDAEKAVNAASAAVQAITATSSAEAVAAAGDALDDAQDEVGKLAYADRAQFAQTLATLEGQLDEDDRLEAIEDIATAVELAGMAADDISGTQAAIMAAKEAIAELPEALQADYMAQLSGSETLLATAISERDEMDRTNRRTSQTGDLQTASTQLQNAVAALAGAIPTRAQLDEADMALDALNTAIGMAEDLTEAEKAQYVREAANAAAPIATARGRFEDEEERVAGVEERERVENIVMAITNMDIKMAGDAVKGVSNAHSKKNNEAVTAAETAIAKAEAAIADADIPETDKERLRALLGVHDGALGRAKAMIAVAIEAMAKALFGKMNIARSLLLNEAMPGKDTQMPTAALGISKVEAKVAGKRPRTVPWSESKYATEAPDLNARANQSLIESPSFGYANSPNVRDHKPERSATQEVKVPGHFDGAPGEYKCANAQTLTCTSQKRANGDIKLTGEWTFAPFGDPSVEIPDTVYVEYGYWLDETAGATHLVNRFVNREGGVAHRDTAGVDSLTNKATYTGHAIGEAVIYETALEIHASGSFTADASLTADFDRQTIEGELTGFEVGANGDQDWHVKFPAAKLNATGGWTGGSPIWSVDDTPSSALNDTDGNWRGGLFDQGAPVGAGAEETRQAVVPDVAAGVFDARYNNTGHMVGVFGAARDEE